MKEATGELSMTAIVVVIIGVIAVAAPPIVKSVIASMSRETKCKSAFNCGKTPDSNGMYTCYYLSSESDTGDPIKISCPASSLGR